jgi:probable O-glycosylation ligase (exosortase A-associated)
MPSRGGVESHRGGHDQEIAHVNEGSVRDYALVAVFFALLPFALARPHVGVLLWTWIGLMSPHRLTWGFAFNFPFAMLAGVVTLIGLLLSREPKRLPLAPPVVTLILLLLWMTVTTAFSLYPDQAWVQWEKVIKIQFFLFVTLIVMQSEARIRALVWVSTLSLAFYGVKGGIYTITRAGDGMVLGPDGSFISGNTEIALALTMTVPLMRWLQVQSESRWIRRALGIGMLLTAVGILGAYSRGGLLAIAAMAAFLWLKTRNKLLIGIGMLLLAPALLMFMPEAWHEKMGTIRSYDEDNSALGRINAWYFAINLAGDRILTGGGFEAFDPEAFLRWAPDPLHFQDAHSIWFEMLGEQGYFGLFLFMLLWLLTWRTGSQVIRLASGQQTTRWAADLARMIQVSLVGYWVGGSFLGLAYWDFPYLLMMILVMTRTVLLRQVVPEATADALPAQDPTVSRSDGTTAPPAGAAPAPMNRSIAGNGAGLGRTPGRRTLPAAPSGSGTGSHSL